MNHAEAVAKLVLENVIPGTMIYQLKQSHGECDFELRYRSGATAAVEVTASADREQLTTSVEHNFNEDCPEASSNRGIQSRPTSSPVVEMPGAQRCI